MRANQQLIRCATAKDLAQVFEIEHEAFSPYGTAEQAAIVAARQTVFPDGFLVVEQDSQIVGYGSSEKWLHDRDPMMEEPPQESHDSEGTILCITAIAVRVGYRGQGFAAAILDELINVANRHHCWKIKLETTHAANFYMHRGFELTKHKEYGGVTFAVLEMELTKSVET